MNVFPFRKSLGVLIAAAGLSALAAAADSAAGVPVLGWGDQGAGTYRNPVLKADYSDPDVIRVGDDFYLVASDFHFVGMQVLHSRDLVNWSVLGQVFGRLTMSPKYDAMNAYAEGTWAPSLRYHDGTYYVFVCTPHDGLFMWHATNPAGPWSATVTVKAVDGWEDPCPFWDEDGKAYLVHSRYGAGPLILHEMSTDGTRLLDEGVEIYRGPVAEGPKLFKRHGWYYISLPEGGVDTGGQTVLRSRSLHGPYERREVLPHGGAHQGGLVELDNSEAWFIGFKSAGRLGRVCHLEPVTWGEDDWPVFGDHGQPVEQWKKPNIPGKFAIERPQASDEFAGPALSPQWQWNHNPVDEAWSLRERPGWLRLRGLPAAEIKSARNTLTQKLWDDAGVVEARLDVSRLADGQSAGLSFMSGNIFGWVGVTREAGVSRVAWDGGHGKEITGPTLWLRGTYAGNTAHLFFSTDGVNYEDTGVSFLLKFSKWKGARLALYCFGAGNGAVDVDYVHYTYGAMPPQP